ncbi:RNA polymerase sigma factor [Pedobacter caeni]|uniref:RNA polymerase sigma-70 factor, ECF subfamily n=1 Tax=Pedobacter caeni TaxID=288992 RepID=A0A1M5B700_9SPHI|nr:RNA polymerase sigma-70 factor [Pedobacter caeni]SHF38228.1 RNA polymerase sigma-70 factor, ECF subfamily [Pedobacter caeni]
MAIYSQLTDAELSGLLKSDDRSAFTEIYDRYNSLLYIYAFKKLKDKEEAQDVVQETFIKLWNNRSGFQLSTSLAGYLYTAVRNRSFDLFAHHKISAVYINSLQSFLNHNESATDHLIREKELTILIEKEISNLPPRMKEIFEMSRKEFMSHKEIADKLGLSEHTITTQIKRALRILRVKLGIIVYLMFYINN